MELQKMPLKTHIEVITNDLASLWLIIPCSRVHGFHLHKSCFTVYAIPTFLITERPVFSNGFFVFDSICHYTCWVVAFFWFGGTM
jgi:hypothetical protein